MRRVRFREYGGPEVLEIAEAELPEPGEGELLVEVGAAGVTLPAVRLTRGGDVPLPRLRAPFPQGPRLRPADARGR